MGQKEIQVVEVDVHGADATRLGIALNRTGELAEWDDDTLAQLLRGLDGATVPGFDEKDIARLFSSADEATEDSFNAAEEAEKIQIPETAPGDIILLGGHRLVCGDATSPNDYRRLMDGAQADLVFTDPPYNVDYEGGTSEKLTIKHDHMADDVFRDFLLGSFSAMFAAAKPGAPVYVCHADSKGLVFREAFESAGWLLKQCLIWAKSSMVLGRQDYQWQHEPILYGWKPGGRHAWFGGRKQKTIIEDTAGVVVEKKKDGAILHFTNGGESMSVKVQGYEIIGRSDGSDSTLWRIEKPLRNGEHPTMKPIPLCGRAIMNSSKAGDIILDPFGGSGSTMMAAEQLGRRCYMMELDPVYCDVIVRRWEALTGQKAKRGDSHGSKRPGSKADNAEKA